MPGRNEVFENADPVCMRCGICLEGLHISAFCPGVLQDICIQACPACGQIYVPECAASAMRDIAR
jgi:hypothetical protein